MSGQTAPVVLRIADVAQRLSVSRAQVYRLIGRGDLATIRVGADMRVTETQFAAFIQALEREAAQARAPRQRPKRRGLRAI